MDGDDDNKVNENEGMTVTLGDHGEEISSNTSNDDALSNL